MIVIDLGVTEAQFVILSYDADDAKLITAELVLYPMTSQL